MTKRTAKAMANRFRRVKSSRGGLKSLAWFFWLVQAGADGDGAVGVHGAVALLDVLDLPFFVDDDGGSLGPLKFSALHVVGLQDLVRGEDFFVHVAEEREGDANLLCESGVCGGTVDADTEDDCVTCFELGHISLIGLEFFGSTTGES